MTSSSLVFMVQCARESAEGVLLGPEAGSERPYITRSSRHCPPRYAFRATVPCRRVSAEPSSVPRAAICGCLGEPGAPRVGPPVHDGRSTRVDCIGHF